MSNGRRFGVIDRTRSSADVIIKWTSGYRPIIIRNDEIAPVCRTTVSLVWLQGTRGANVTKCPRGIGTPSRRRYTRTVFTGKINIPEETAGGQGALYFICYLDEKIIIPTINTVCPKRTVVGIYVIYNINTIVYVLLLLLYRDENQKYKYHCARVSRASVSKNINFPNNIS